MALARTECAPIGLGKAQPRLCHCRPAGRMKAEVGVIRGKEGATVSVHFMIPIQLRKVVDNIISGTHFDLLEKERDSSSRCPSVAIS